MDAMEEGGVYPVYHVFAGVAELGKLAEVEVLDGRAALRLAALAGITHDGRKQLWLANLNSVPADVILNMHTKFESACVYRLDEHHHQRTWQTPDAWRRTVTGELLSGANPRLVVPGFGLGVIEFLA